MAKISLVREKLHDPRGVPFQLSGASPYPTLSLVVVPEEV